MKLVDMFCGVGGFSAGAREFAKPVLGVDNDDVMVRLWAANTKGKGQLAELWRDHVELPRPTDSTQESVHIHISPPCTTLSRARRHKQDSTCGVAHLRETLDFLSQSNYASWSVETVSTPVVQELLSSFCEEHSEFKFAWTVVDAAEYGSPSTRVRIIIGNPDLVLALRQIPVSRVSVADAFRRCGIGDLPADYIKNNSKTRTRQPCVRHISQPCHTQTASHPLIWCTSEGQTVRCLNVQETAIIMGFPLDWMLPTTSRAAIKAIGNAVPPPLAAAIMSAAKQCW